MMKREQDGTLNQYLANLRSRDREARIAILNKAFSDAIAAASHLDTRSDELQALTADLKDKLARLRTLQANGSKLSTELAGLVFLPEDFPIAERRTPGNNK
jgi:ABC-type phosphate transport system auxiliary subunit